MNLNGLTLREIMSAPKYVVHANEIDEASDSQLVGSKALGLSKLLHLGVAVPDFVVVTCRAWNAFCAPALTSFYSRLRKASQLPTDALSQLSRDIDAALHSVAIDTEVSNAIDKAFPFQKGLAVAVRSSAVAEDLPDLSFSGIYESFLNVVPGDILDRIRKCWSSAFSPRAIKYLAGRSDLLPLPMAVIVQEMCRFELSGVIFTRDPVGQKHILIEAMRSETPDDIVGGRVSPSRFLFDRHFDLVEKTDAFNIPVGKLRKAAEISSRIESALNVPQDIEFGIMNSRVIVLQTRPITTLDKKG